MPQTLDDLKRQPFYKSASPSERKWMEDQIQTPPPVPTPMRGPQPTPFASLPQPQRQPIPPPALSDVLGLGAGIAADVALGPEAGPLVGPVVRSGASALGGYLGAKLGNEPDPGTAAVRNLLTQGAGEVGVGALKLAGQGIKSIGLAGKDAKRIAKVATDKIPWLKNTLEGTPESVGQTFWRGGPGEMATNIVGRRYDKEVARISEDLRGHRFDFDAKPGSDWDTLFTRRAQHGQGDVGGLPATQQAGGLPSDLFINRNAQQGQAQAGLFDASGSPIGRTAGPIRSVEEQAKGLTFDEVNKLIEDLYHTRFYPNGSERNAWQAVNDMLTAGRLRDELAEHMDRYMPGLGEQWLKARRQYNISESLTQLFDAAGDEAFDPRTGKLNLRALQEVLRKDGDLAARFRTSDDAWHVLKEGVFRGKSPIRRDVSGKAGIHGYVGPTGMPHGFIAPPRIPGRVGVEAPKFLSMPGAREALPAGLRLEELYRFFTQPPPDQQ